MIVRSNTTLRSLSTSFLCHVFVLHCAQTAEYAEGAELLKNLSDHSGFFYFLPHHLNLRLCFGISCLQFHSVGASLDVLRTSKATTVAGFI